MRVRSQTAADDGFDKNVAEKMPKVKKEEEFSPPEVEIQPLQEGHQEIRPEVRSQEREVEKKVTLPPPQGREREKHLDVSGLIEDLQTQLLTLGKTRRALEVDLASDRKTIFQLAQDNKELRSQLEDLNKEIQGYIITSFLYPDNPHFNFDRFYNKLNDRGFVIYPGKLSKANAFRIGNIGQIFPDDVSALIVAIREVLAEEKISLTVTA
ncbi:MAG: hypothetical protein Q8939_13725 [Bacteroidota bacterium]|nr:hypothetical protein [Bacteroidota bacterium]